MVQLQPDPPQNPVSGAIAQLGERLLCKQEVTGSIPVGSTSLVHGTRNAARSARQAAALRSAFRRFFLRTLYGCSLTIRKKQGELECDVAPNRAPA